MSTYKNWCEFFSRCSMEIICVQDSTWEHVWEIVCHLNMIKHYENQTELHCNNFQLCPFCFSWVVNSLHKYTQTSLRKAAIASKSCWLNENSICILNHPDYVCQRENVCTVSSRSSCCWNSKKHHKICWKNPHYSQPVSSLLLCWVYLAFLCSFEDICSFLGFWKSVTKLLWEQQCWSYLQKYCHLLGTYKC